MDFEVVLFLPIYARKYANHNRSLLGRQTINALARPTNSADELFCGQRKGGKY